jgi:hypothetical protein
MTASRPPGDRQDSAAGRAWGSSSSSSSSKEE